MKIAYLTCYNQSIFSIQTTCPNLALALHLKYGTTLTTTPMPTQHTITINKNSPAPGATLPESAPTYTIIHTSEEGTVTSTTQYPLQAIDDILYSSLSLSPDIFALHGAAIACNGHSCLFLGATTSGKTTLTSYLTSQGFGYITDDCILLNRETFTISPCTTPLHLRSGGLEVLRKYSCIPDTLEFLDEETFPRYVYTPDNCVTVPLPLGRIFFITRTEQVNRLEDMGMTERITALMKAPIVEYPVDSSYLRFLTRLAKVPCNRLLYCDMNYVKEILKK